MNDDDPIHALVSNVCAVRYEDLPQQVIDTVKRGIIDTVGAGIAGRSAEMGKIVVEMARANGGRSESAIWTCGFKVPAAEAAFVNAVMARCRELDDVHEGSPRTGIGHGGHVNVMIVPAALAALEALQHPLSGKEFITAVAVGGDLIPRLRMAAGNAGRLGWEGPTVSPFGVAATVGRIRGFDPKTMANAMGAAYAQCAGNILSTSDGTWDVWLNAGIGARGGMLAAELASRGHQGARSPLLGECGLYSLYFRGEYHAEALLSELGSKYESGNVSIKPYSSCKGTHHAIYTALELVSKNGIAASAIKAIQIDTSDYNMRIAVLNEFGEPKYAPRNLNEAQFSMPFTVATAIVKGSVFPDVMDESILNDPDILNLSRKITIKVTPEKNELAKREGYPPVDLRIVLHDGRSYAACELYVKGHPLNPMSFEQVVEKFWKCVGVSGEQLSRDKLQRFCDNVVEMDQVSDARTVATWLQ